MSLKTASLIISIVGILLLFIIVYFIPPKQIGSQSELKENLYVKVNGKVISERTYDDFSIIKLDNNITITCNCKGFINRTIEVMGKVEKYENSLQIKAYKIKEK